MKENTSNIEKHISEFQNLSQGQLEIWLLQQRSPDLVFNISEYALISGRLDHDRLNQAISNIVSATPELRVRFVEKEGKPLRYIDNSIQGKLSIFDYRDKQTAHTDAIEWINRDMSTSLCLENDALFRFALFITADENYIFYNRYHHIICDGRSISIIEKKISEAYQRLMIDDQDTDNTLGSACTDNSSLTGDAKYLQSRAYQKDHEFWQQIGKRLPSPWLSFISATPDSGDILKNEQPLSDLLHQRISKYASETGLQDNHLYITAIAAHFSILTGLTEMSFGFPVIGAIGPERERPGMTSNTLPLLVSISAEDAFKEIATRIRSDINTLLRHQRYRGEAILREQRLPAHFGPTINLIFFDRGAPFYQTKNQWFITNGSQNHGFSIVLNKTHSDEGMSIEFYASSKRHSADELAQHQLQLTAILDYVSAHPGHTVEQLKLALAPHFTRSTEHSIFTCLRPAYATGVINWQTDDARYIANLATAMCRHEKLPVPASSCKMIIQQNIIIAEEIHILSTSSATEPGTVIKISDAGWHISTLSADILISKLFTLNGEQQMPRVFARQMGIAALSLLRSPDQSGFQQLEKEHQLITRHEAFWLEKLQRFSPLALPWPLNSAQLSPNQVYLEWQPTGKGGTTMLLISFFSWLRVFCSTPVFQVGWKTPPSKAALHSAWVPMDIDLSDERQDITAFIQQLNNELNQLAKHGSYLTDLPYRHSLNRQIADHVWDIGVELLSNSANNEGVTGAHSPILTLQIDPGHRYRFICDATRLSPEFIQHFSQELAAGITSAESARRIEEVTFLSPGERFRHTAALRQTFRPFSQDHCLHQLFEQQVARDPQAIAILDGITSLTYRQVDNMAGRIASQLHQAGIQPDDPVALCLPRGAGQFIALLAILKSGGCYVPIDADYPAERKRELIYGSRPVALLTDAAGHNLNEHHPGMAIFDMHSMLTDENQSTFSSREVTSHHLAYVIFTSGSTGTPKGVMVEHAQVVNFYYALSETILCHYPPQAKVCQNYSLSFDASVQSILCLLSGHQLVITPTEVRRDGHSLVAFIEQQDIDVFESTPVQLDTLLIAGLLNNPKPLVMHIGGEAISESSWQRLAASEHLRAFNIYGPTECTVGATAAHINQTSTRPVIGSPLANYHLYLLDDQLNPVPYGIAGEMYIGGAGVARGYLHQPELTAERFLPDIQSKNSARMYRTGDMARYLANGQLEFLGRSDDQVKMNGFRIEPAEIGKKVAAHTEVSQALVIARQGNEATKQLVCYFVPQCTPAAEHLPRKLRDDLREQLPEFMIPTAWVPVNHFPLTPNGKIDIKALPEPGADAYLREAFEPPEGETEQLIARLWSEILPIAQPGRHDNFFTLGGDSLNAMRLVNQLSPASVGDFFAYPTIAQLAARLSELRAIPDSAITPRVPEAIIPLSFSQQRLWFIDQLANRDENYLVPTLLALQGPLDQDRLAQSLNALFSRHEALRSTFSQDGTVCTLLGTDCVIPLNMVNLSTSPECDEAIQQLYLREMNAPFDLTTGPLIRTTLAQTGHERYLLLIIIHHIVTDGHSVAMLMQELGKLYNSPEPRRDNPLPELKLQYPDFALWQQQQQGSEAWQKQEQFWLSYLRDLPPQLTLPTDRPRPAVQSFQGDQIPLILDPQLTMRLKTFSQQHGMTLFNTLLTGWAALLTRLAGQDDIAIGVAVANRQQPGTESMAGFLVNTLALRIISSPEMTMTELATTVRHSASEAFRHQELPFERVVELINPERSRDKTPLIQVIFAWNNINNPPPEMSGLIVTPVAPPVHRVKFDLELTLSEQDGAITGSLNFATALFDRETMERHCEYLMILLRAISEHSQQPYRQINILSPQEQQRLIHQWNATELALPPFISVHQQIEAHALNRPDADAVIAGDVILNYQQLNYRANRLAQQLIASGIGPEDRVVICTHRTPEMIIAILASLKAGAGYLPVAPEGCSKRLAFILQDASPAAIIAVDQTQSAVEASGIPLFLLSEEYDVPCEPYDNPQTTPSADQLVYIIYTSGSTGNPKGVMIEHGQLCSIMHTWQQRCGFNQNDRMLQFCHPTFDASVSEVFSTLTSGAALILRDDSWLTSGDIFWQYCTDYQITSLILPWQFWRSLCNDSNAPLPLSLRMICFAGEAADPKVIKRWLDKYPNGPILINGYGPTETTIVATSDLPAMATDHIDAIGYPLPHTRLYILDAWGQPVPRGVTGELYIGGVGVARGYLNRPDLTQQSFLPDPFSRDPSARMYRTGDQASYLADGRVFYQGRNDHQIKIRGFRIEPGEIEAQLNTHPHIRESVVMAIKQKSGDKQIAIWFVTEPDQQADNHELHHYLSGILPDYMVPAAWIKLDAMPLTPSGKVDRKALPAPEISAILRSQHAAPVTAMEKILATIWEDLLNVKQPGRHDHFFQSGGHSLLAIRMISELEKQTGVRIPVTALFEHPVLSHLAEFIQQQDQGIRLSGPQVISRLSTLPLSPSQQRLWFLSQLNDKVANYNVLLPVRLEGEINLNALRQAINLLYQRHESLRSRFMAGPEQPFVILNSTEEELPLIIQDYRQHADQDNAIKLWLYQEETWLFDLSHHDLIRVSLLQLEDQVGLLILNLHHIITDGWSMDILLRELSAAYSALCQQTSPDLPELPYQYVDYAAWQITQPGNEACTAAQQYWKQQLDGTAERLLLPVDRTRPSRQSFSGAVLPIELDHRLSAQIVQLSQQHGVSLFVTLLSAWAVVLSRLSGQRDFLIGAPAANRDLSGCEDIIGFFVNTLALRINLTESPDTTTLLRQVSQTVRSGQAHQSLPFEQVVALMQPERSSECTPLFQVMFAMQDTVSQMPQLAGLVTTLMMPPANRVKFELELSFELDDGQLKGSFSYATALFDQETMIRHRDYLMAILEGMVGDNAQAVESIGIISPRERSLMLDTWQHATLPLSKQPAHVCFEYHAGCTPDAVALRWQEHALTYAELNQRASALAYQLHLRGVKAEDRIAICSDRSPELIIAILAVLKAGAGWLALADDTAPDRLNYMLEDARPSIILVKPHTQQRVSHSGIPCLLITDSAYEPIAFPAMAIKPSSLAYIIYTSGSTGKPKGVMIEHGNLSDVLADWSQFCQITQYDRVLQFSSISFDVSVMEIFAALSHGATLVLRDDEWISSCEAFWEKCRHYGITYLDLPWQFMRKLCDESKTPLPPSIRMIGFGGEAAMPESINRWYSRYPDSPRLLNIYGPTETTILCSVNKVNPLDKYPESIGFPVESAKFYILDNRGNLVPAGSAGELYIGGSLVARGYLNRPELTAEHFLPDPFSNQQGARMYRTGDLASYLPDGRVMFLGRNDHQIKIRGYRVEPGEIENHLVTHPLVSEAVVMPWHDENQHLRLVAWLVMTSSQPGSDIKQVRESLSKQLPEYMIPSAWITLDHLPLNHNGKIDRHALPAPQEAHFIRQTYEAPLDGLEQIVADLWQTLLAISKIGRNDNFFELGGHSLLAVSLVARLRSIIDQPVTVGDLFAAPGLAQFAARIAGQQQTPSLVLLEQEAMLPTDIQPVTQTVSEQGAVLLTGATGFIGRFLLRELLDTTDKVIYCLVRNSADQRLQQIMQRASLWQETDIERVIIIEGNLKLPRLGIEASLWHKLSQTVSVIYHSAVSMNHLESLDLARAANISGTLELLRLAGYGRNKRVNFLSTTNVFLEPESGERHVDETTSTHNEPHLSSQGYITSKWIGEELIQQAVARGFSCAIFRAGLITPDSRLARYDKLQAFHRHFSTSLKMGMAFDDIFTDIPLTPVDFVAKALVYLGMRDHQTENVFHLAAMESLSRGEFIEQLNQHLPVPLQRVDYRQWLREARQRSEHGEVLPSTPLIQDLMMADDATITAFYRRYRTSSLHIDSSWTLKKLEEAGITIPAVNTEWFRQFVITLQTL